MIHEDLGQKVTGSKLGASKDFSLWNPVKIYISSCDLYAQYQFICKMNWLTVVCFSWKKCYMSLKNNRFTRVEATFKEKNATSLKIYKFRGVCKIGTCSHDRCGDPQPRCKAIPKTILQRWKIGPLNKGSNIFFHDVMWPHFQLTWRFELFLAGTKFL